MSMKIDYLPVEGEKGYTMFAYYDETKNEVHWSGVTDNNNSYMEHVCGTELAQFTVCRRGKVVIVESCGWYSPEFHYKMELTELPSRVVMLAAHAAGLMDQAYDDESPFSNVG